MLVVFSSRRLSVIGGLDDYHFAATLPLIARQIGSDENAAVVLRLGNTSTYGGHNDLLNVECEMQWNRYPRPPDGTTR